MEGQAARTPSKQASLTTLWKIESPTPEQTPSTHKKLRTSRYESPASQASFYKELEAKRLEAEKAEKERE